MTSFTARLRTLLGATSIGLFSLGLLSSPLLAASVHDQHAMTEMSMDVMAPAPVSTYTLTGKVVALQKGRVVLSHQAVAALSWPAMTMPFQLATPELVQGLTPGLQIEAQFALVENDSPRILHWQAVK
jgi:Cu/Ag efflux protein CusF